MIVSRYFFVASLIIIKNVIEKTLYLGLGYKDTGRRFINSPAAPKLLSYMQSCHFMC